MGVHEGCAQPDGFCPNGLLPNEGMLVAGLLDMERWSRAEDRAAELIACIQPNRASEECRNAVTCYVQRLIMQCFSCQVITFGSVPLKTYLPDGDIDLTAFSTDQNLNDTWASKVRNMLESEEKSLDAEFCVKEVQYIQAEVKIVKCLIENIVVDISFNQLGGLCTLCFLEEVDHLINQSHLFKRSIILIKAWCHYESRILGAHHGLISTYALETLVLYIFHVFNNSFSGPLEVLYYFMEFFSKFDWDNFCVSLYGPVPVNQLPDITAAPPRKDGGELLLSKLFLHACSSVYAVYPCGREHQDHPFISKHFNVIDPLRTDNNLGRSVSKGNLFRIRSAFAFGAQQLTRLLGCPRANVVSEVDHFFLNTWDRHRKSHRPDVPRPGPYVLQPVNLNHTDGSYNLKNYSTIKRAKEGSTSYESKFGKPPYSAFHAVSLQHDSTSLRPTSVIDTVPAVSRAQETCANLTRLKSFDQNYQIVQCTHSNKHTAIGKGTSCTSEYPWNIQAQYHFIRLHCPDLAVAKTRNPSRGRHSQRTENQSASEMTDNSRQGNFKSKILETHVAASLDEDPPSSGHPFLASSGHSHKKSAVCHYVSEAGMASNQDEIVEAAGDSLESAEMNQKDSNHCLLAEGASSSIRRSDTSGGSSGAGWLDEKQRFTSPGNHPSVKENEEFMRENNDGNHKSVKENKELMRENYSEDCSDQNVTRNATYSTAHLKIPPSSKSTLSRSGEYSESSWGGSITEVSKLKKDGQGSQLPFSMDPYIVYGLDKSGRLYEGRLPSHVTLQGDDDNRNWIPLSTVATKVAQHIVSSHSEANQKLGHQPAHLGVINSSENHIQPETLNNYNPVKRGVYVEPCEQHKSDILNSDYASHCNNLQYGRLSQSSQHLGHFMYSSCVDLLPMYSECRFPWHGTGRPPDNADLFYQHMDDCSHFVPESTLEPVSIRPTDIYQHYGDDIPRHHGETGTYLPNPKPDKDRQSSKTRSHRMTHGYDWMDRHGDSKGNWNPNSKARHLGRGQRCSLEERPHRRSGWIAKRNSHSRRADSFEDTSLPLYISQDGLFSSLYSVRCSSGSETYGLHPPPTASSDMLYSHEQKISYRSSAQQLEFGCLGPVDFSGTNGKLHLGGSSFQGGTMNFRGGSDYSLFGEPSSLNL